MNILVCISKAPDTTSKITFKNKNTAFNEDGVQFIVNPYDEWYALVRALELKEAQGGKVTIVSVGGADVEPVMRKALAIGADEAARIDANPTDAFQVASEIATYCSQNSFDLILVGKETIDYNGSQVGGMLAAIVDLPFVSNVSKLEVSDGKAQVERDKQGGNEVAELNLPCVISSAKGMAEQRIPNMRGIMAARTKPLTVIPSANPETLTEITAFTLPPEKGSVKLIDPDNMEELVNLLHNEAKVI
ncbi:MAG: electron transfer flavoprotein subunit beta/FixA family protein [Flavobacteriales bacterium]|jgi:electron transfer flavoprotein beta subunit|nr:electron transfer flavoprotein subunit beta/FixA family protein [Flavobacteriales bacterium]NCG30164.1 electron transfer flavoprotein beta subunit/FixA family protein [Bacteroidota bacterium]MBT3962910.1 electron transfer flavoprotein subunit beta/FixA family protein [Flavobacteriales bacterium]MBT4705276.1 electron transfer flavoprotein subunit beta/FixA family protein [Flavobacteriales bacterium]MBT4930898.1 electron transfer flavoprotein subunit beta/FixA family protein [Flavobacteriales 